MTQCAHKFATALSFLMLSAKKAAMKKSPPRNGECPHTTTWSQGKTRVMTPTGVGMVFANGVMTPETSPRRAVLLAAESTKNVATRATAALPVPTHALSDVPPDPEADQNGGPKGQPGQFSKALARSQTRRFFYCFASIFLQGSQANDATSGGLDNRLMAAHSGFASQAQVTAIHQNANASRYIRLKELDSITRMPLRARIPRCCVPQRTVPPHRDEDICMNAHRHAGRRWKLEFKTFHNVAKITPSK